MIEIRSLIPRYPNITLEEAEEHVKEPELGGTTYPLPTSKPSKTAVASDGVGHSKLGRGDA